MTTGEQRYPYPRRVMFRSILRTAIRAVFSALARFEITGKENIPESGPLLIVGNHFSFLDPLAIVYATDYHLDFFAGHRRPNAPRIVRMLPELWGVYEVYRGTSSRDAIRAAEAIMHQNGVLCLFPEAGSWATVLRPPRPGAAFIAAHTGARILPIGLDGLPEVFPSLRKGRRTTVTINIGKPFGPVKTSGRGKARRDALEAISREIMEHVAALIPPERRGYYSEDPELRKAAEAVAEYPWDDTPDTI